MQPNPYPPTPPNTRPLKSSAAFKKEVTKVTGAIILFFIVYLLLLVTAGLLAAACFFIGIKVMIALTSLYGILAGIGIMAVGLSVLFFLIKFIFSVTKQDDDSRIQVFESSHPALFAFLRELARDTKTRFPKKIFVSPAVNACVFYNSSFWSMFFPIRKNLEIGLGLVNTVNLSEFKAVMAHEFGHFSQKSMKLGSFTYNVNHIIYNLLYDNKSYQRFLNGWGKLHGVLSVFAYITVGIAQGIQSILKGMYQLINKQYLGLSRQMEFNADAIAATVAGSNNMVNALNRLELSSNSYNTALQKADDFLKEKLISQNIFNNQRLIMYSLADQLQLSQAAGLPQVTRQFLNSFSRSRVNYKNQWASHPTNEEREAELEQLNLTSATDNRSAWVLFDDAETLQQNITRHIYRNVTDTDQMQHYDNHLFEQRYTEETAKYQLPQVLKQFYSQRFIDVKDWYPEIVKTDEAPDITIQAIFSDAYCNLPEQLRNNESDLVILQAISEKKIDVKSFDFDGEKYDAGSAADIIVRLKEEVETQKKQLKALDKKLYHAFYQRALHSGVADALFFQQLYISYQYAYQYEHVFSDTVDKIVEVITPFYQGGISIEQVDHAVSTLKQSHEIALKARLREILADDTIAAQLPTALKEQMVLFNSKHYYYFLNKEFVNGELDHLYNTCRSVREALAEIKFAAYKQLLCKQAALLD